MTTTIRKGSGRPAAAARRKKAAQREVVSVKPDPRTWAAALELADGDATRLRADNRGMVIISNQPRKRDPNANKWVR